MVVVGLIKEGMEGLKSKRMWKKILELMKMNPNISSLCIQYLCVYLVLTIRSSLSGMNFLE